MGVRQSRDEAAAAGDHSERHSRLGCFTLRRRKTRFADDGESDKEHAEFELGSLQLSDPPASECEPELRNQLVLSSRSSPLAGGRRAGARGSWKGKNVRAGGVGAQGGDLINQLPEECLAAIFEKAGGGSSKVIASVCRKWKEILVGSRSVFLLPQCDPEKLGSLLSLLPGLTSLKVARTLEGGCFRTSDEALAAIGQHCAGLEAVDLGYNFLEGDKGTGPMQDAPRCGSYISIGGDGSSREYSSVTSKGIALLAQQCSNLRRLGLRRVFREETGKKEGEGTLAIAEGQLEGGSDEESLSGGEGLTDVYLPSVSEIQEGGVEKMPEERCCEGIDAALAALARYSSHLEYLNLAYCSGLSNRGLQEIGFISTLTTLDLSGSSGWSDEGLALIGAGCRRLRHLSLACVSGIRDSGLQLFAAKGCPNLRTVIIWGAGRYNHVTHVGIAALGEAAGGLRCLDLTMAKTVSDEWLASIGKKCSALEELCLDYCDCSFSQDGVDRLVKGCRQLEKLRMGGVIDGRGLSVDHRHDSVLFPLRAAANLRALDLRDCQGVTDILLGHIVAGCPQMEQLRLSNTCIKVQRPCPQPGASLPLSPLKKLNLGFCRYLKRDGLLSFLSGSYAAFPRLEELSIRACLAADDEVLEALATACTALRRLDLTGCKNVSDRGVAEIAERCKQLAWLNLSGCDKVTGAGFRPGCPSLTLLCIGKGITNAGAARIAASCPQLAFLLIFLEARSNVEIRHAPRKLTDAGVTAFRGCKMLQTLRLCNCDEVTNEALEKLAVRLPMLRKPYRLWQREQERLQRLLKVWFSPGCLTRVEDTWPLLSNSLQFFDPQLNATLDS